MRARVLAATSGAERLSRLAVLGLLVVPLFIGGILVWALAAPTEHLDRVTAAIVNDDEPVTVNGQTVPLGREFAAGLIDGSSATDASAGASGSDASAGASATDASAPNFTWVLTNDDEAATGLTSGRYVAVVTIPQEFSATATSIGGPAADAEQAVIEVETTPASAFLDPALTGAVTAAATAALNQQLIAQYLGNVYAGFNTINEQIGQAASGAADLSAGASSLDSGAQSLASGAGELASGTGSLDAGAEALAGGLAELDAASQPLPDQTAQLAQGAGEVATAVDALASAVGGATDEFAAVVAEICLLPGPLCDRATAALQRLENADQQVGQLASGADQVASGSEELADAMPQLVEGIDQSASGAAQVAAGAAQVNSGARQLSSGAQGLASGAGQVDDGAAQLAAGLAQAVEQIPTYSDSDIATLTSVVSQPVRADATPIEKGFQSLPLFCVIALWLGGLVIALARQAVPTRELLTATSSASIALRAVLPTVALGAAQGAVVAVTVLFAVRVDPWQWLAFTSASVLIGTVFAVTNQGLAAAFGAAGRLVAVVIALVALTAGLSSTVPAAIEAVAAALPTTSALGLLLAALTGDAGIVLPSLTGLVLTGIVAVALVLAGVSARRQVRALAGKA
ncbi:hypothetical protein ACFWN7_11490 [Agromyces sp. NPDC058484]|uniref:hypothetical protein n=1 Tax=Agromyces sp. NPDC058484 TaxID=3346524 RepID=UPI00365A87F1